MTLAKGVEHFKNMLQSMKDTIENDPTATMDDFPIIQQVLGRYSKAHIMRLILLVEFILTR